MNVKPHHRRSASQAFVTPAGARFISSSTNLRSLSGRRHCATNHSLLPAPTSKRRQTPVLSVAEDRARNRKPQSNHEPPSPRSSSSSPKKRLSWPQVVLLTAGTALSTTFGMLNTLPSRASDEKMQTRATITATNRAQHSTSTSRKASPWSPLRVSSSSASSSSSSALSSVSSAAKGMLRNRKSVTVACHNSISLDALGIKRDDFLSDRELRRRKTTQFSEAEQEIMELEEWEVDTQWFRDMQTMWAALASIGGIFVLYKGGVMWEKWIKEQEKKDMEEEIKLTGKFVDPRAVRKDEDEDPKKKTNTKTPTKPSDSDGGKGPSLDGGGGDIESLEKLFGKS